MELCRTKLPEDLELKTNTELAEYERTEKRMIIETLLAPIQRLKGPVWRFNGIHAR